MLRSTKILVDANGFKNKSCFLPGGRSHALKQLNQFKPIAGYDVDRDFPGLNKTSSISPYIRFGCISIRELVRFSLNHESTGADIWLSELIWHLSNDCIHTSKLSN